MHAIARYVRNIWDGLYTTVAGMRVTFKYLHSPVTTLQYPDERMPMFERFRGLLHNRIWDCNGRGQARKPAVGKQSPGNDDAVLIVRRYLVGRQFSQCCVHLVTPG